MTSLPLRRIALATIALAMAATAAAAAAAPSPHHRYRYSVVNQKGYAFSMTVTPLFVSPMGSGTSPPISEPTAGGQHLLGSALRTAGVYDLPAGARLPVSDVADLPAGARRVNVSIHFN
ncbi:MAG: hypothetical protein JWP92_685 [Caulobacter sp.]|nr:hypothetical protein [Caulobacter sp.]